MFTRDLDRRAASYQGTLKNAFALGTLPAAVAVCLDTAICLRPSRRRVTSRTTSKFSALPTLRGLD